MINDLENLKELEAVNVEIARLSEEIAALPKRTADIEAKLQAAKSQLEKAAGAIKAQEALKRSLEGDIQDRNQKIVRYREQSTAVKTNEQYKALMHEIEFAEKEIAGFEEKIIQGMESADALKAEQSAADGELKTQSVEIDKEKAHAREVTAEDEKKLTELRARKEELRKKITPATLAEYERIATKKKGAIAEAFEQKCTACHMQLRPQRFNELITGGVMLPCESCRRLLYYDPTHVSTIPKVKLNPNEKAWFYVPAPDSGRFLRCANSKAGCTMAAFDAASGELREKLVKKKVSFREAFAEQLAPGVSLRLDQHLEADAERLPADMLEELQLQAGVVTSDTEIPASQ